MPDTQTPRPRYRSIIADSARWDGFALRPGDIVVSTPPKSGTTLVQMLCALLIFDGPDFPAPLEQMSPWLDAYFRPLPEVNASLAAQRHRRIIKTHTPLDGLPIHAGVTYLVVGRDPRDVAVSYMYHVANLDFGRFLELRAAAIGDDALDELPMRRLSPHNPAGWFHDFSTEASPGTPPTLASVLHHLNSGWQRQDAPNVALLHYADLTTDLAGEILRLAAILGIVCTPERARDLAQEASLERMRARASSIAPSASQGPWKDVSAFFRHGGCGEWRALFAASDLAAYDARVAEHVGPDLAAWVHSGWRALDTAPPG